MEEHKHLPDLNRLSIVTATIMLAYALIPHISHSGNTFAFQLRGFTVQLPVGYGSLITFFAAGIAAAGTDWLLQGHPYCEQKVRLSHWVLPALTAWIIGVPLGQLDVGFGWWIIFGMGSALLILVVVAEYITLDNSDARQVPASLGLSAMAFAILMVVLIAIRGVGFRLYLVELAVIPAIALVILRTLNLKLDGRWCWSWAIAISLIVGDLAFGLHYTSLSPLRYGLILTGCAYALTSLAEGWETKQRNRSIWIEPLVTVLAVTLLVVFINA
jgi:uncharacterized membrane protein YecN with MAPEG domain